MFFETEKLAMQEVAKKLPSNLSKSLTDEQCLQTNEAIVAFVYWKTQPNLWRPCDFLGFLCN